MTSLRLFGFGSVQIAPKLLLERRRMRFAVLPAACIAFAAPALAAQSSATLGIDTDKPIAVNGDSFTADLNAETGTFTGNVIVTQGEVRLRADTVTVVSPGGNTSRLEARGNVVVDSPSGTARGASAVYDVPAEVIRLSGPVVLTKDQNVMRGSALVVEVGTGIARLTGGVAASGQPQTRGNGRVQGLFVPQQGNQTPNRTP
jgi:lipopolysaccharide export system protein LptA